MAPGELGPALSSQDHIVFNGVSEYQATPTAVFRDMGHTRTPLFTRIHDRNIPRPTDLAIFDLGNGYLPAGDLTHAR